MTDCWSIGDALHLAIRSMVSAGSTILELGSGSGTGRLAAGGYVVFSVEHDQRFLNLYDSHYIYAPLRHGWYCPHMIEQWIPSTYDALLIDGPPGDGCLAMAKHLDLIDLSVPIFVDDLDRRECLLLAEIIAAKCGRPLQTISENDGRQAGMIE